MNFRFTTYLALGALLFGSYLPTGSATHYDDQPLVAEPLRLIEDDIWHRWHQSRSMPRQTNERIEEQTRFLLGGRRTLQRTLDRGGPFLFQMVEALEQTGLPTELALLPAIESAYQIDALSPASAAGLWQFIPDTARRFGLQIDSWQDQRLSPALSTGAATRFISHLAKRYHNDWLLVLAAYNTGPGNVDKALARARRSGIDPVYWNLRLPTETMLYVPRFLALLNIVDDYAQSRITLTPTDNRPGLVSIDLQRRFSLTRLAQVFKLSAAERRELKRLNKNLLRGASPPDGPHVLTTGRPLATRLYAKMADPHHLQQPWHDIPVYHKVVAGDNLSSIAKRYNRSVAELQTLNNLPDSRIIAGRKLLVGRDTAAEPASEIATAAQPTPAFPDSSDDMLAFDYRTWRVRQGESLWQIARKLDTSSAAIRSWNANLQGKKHLDVGSSIRHARLIRSDTSQLPAFYYRVRSGDSLASLAEKFSVSGVRIRHFNEMLSTMQSPRAGQILRIPFAAN